MAQKTIHMGGKVDIYLKGSELAQKSLDFLATTNTLYLSTKYSEINRNSVSAANITDTTKTVSFTITEGSDDTAVVNIDNTNNLSYNSAITSEIQIAYLDTGGAPHSDVFSVGAEIVELESPCIGTIHVSKTGDSSQSYDKSYYDLMKTTLDGTVIDSSSPYYLSNQERTYFRFHDNSGVPNGSPISVSYSVNLSVQLVDDYYNAEENRIITTDLLIKEANCKYINMAFSVVLKESETLDDSRKSQILHAVENYITNLKIGESVKESDVVGAIYANPDIAEYLYYVTLPFKCFYVPDTTTEPMPDEGRRDGTIITPDSVEYIALNKSEIVEVING